MSTGDIITLVGIAVGFLLQAGVILVGAAFAWGRVKGTLESLTKSIADLARSVSKLEDKIDGHAERLATLEAGRKRAT